MSKYIEGEEPGIFPRVLLGPLSMAYGATVRTRLALYRLGLLRQRSLPCKVISVGNLTVGGSGKTPVTIHIARTLTSMGFKTAILSRGYMREGSGVEVVTDGNEILLKPLRAGDEPYLMAESLEGVPVIVGKSRYRGGLLAAGEFSPEVVILDDGFQHIGVKRDLNLLLVDSVRGFGNKRLAPLGPLREPLSGAERADALMLKGDSEVTDPALKEIADEKPCFRFTYQPTAFTDLSGEKTRELGIVTGRRVLALAGIADPSSFVETLKALGAEVATTLAFPDHHKYTDKDIKTIRDGSREVDYVVTTEKDAARLKAADTRAAPLIYALKKHTANEGRDAYIEMLREKTGLNTAQ